MIRYLSLTLENFLVFKGTQTVNFPASDGVVVIYGQNGKGKTSLLNAFRFAFTGTALRRGNRPIRTSSLLNREALAENGDAPVPCRVKLDFMVDGDLFELTRRVVPTPTGDFASEVILVKNNQALSLSDAEQTVAEIMPPEVEQCFHFDGELLAQYEQLVEADSPAGAQLKESIESILGVPMLENAERDARYAADEAGKVLATAAKADNRTRELGQALDLTNTQVEAHRDNFNQERDRVLDLEARLRDVTQDIAEQGNKLDLLARRDAQAAQVEQLQAEEAIAREALALVLPLAWKAALVDPLRERLEVEELARDEGMEELRSATINDWVSSSFKEREESSCPVCEQGVEESARVHIHGSFPADPGGPEGLLSSVQSTSERIKVLRRSLDEEARARLKAAEEAFRLAVTKTADAREDLEALEEQLLDASEDDLRELARQSSDLGAQLSRARDVRDAEQVKLRERQQAAEALREQIRKVGGVNVNPAVQATAELANRLADLFREATANYRAALKASVQSTATDLFTKMRTESEFRQLAINDSFGLQIVDSDGRIVELRSAGYEHLVALALVGAIQAASPISGPIVMDSPFGRLDPNHVTAVVDNLNLLTNQVILLAHEGEITSDVAHDLLDSRLLAEFDLVRVSHYFTRLVEKRSS